MKHSYLHIVNWTGEQPVGDDIPVNGTPIETPEYHGFLTGWHIAIDKLDRAQYLRDHGCHVYFDVHYFIPEDVTNDWKVGSYNEALQREGAVISEVGDE